MKMSKLSIYADNEPIEIGYFIIDSRAELYAKCRIQELSNLDGLDKDYAYTYKIKEVEVNEK